VGWPSQRGATINSEQYVQTFNKLKQIRRVWPNRKLKQAPPPPARCQTANLSAHKEGKCNNGVGCLPYPPYRPNLAPSDFHHFGLPNNALSECHFADNDKLKHSVHEELWCSSKEFYTTSTWHLKQRWNKVSTLKETSWKNNLSLIKDAPTIYTKFSKIVITVIEKKHRRHYFHTTPIQNHCKQSTSKLVIDHTIKSNNVLWNIY
jgi:hypothetical protein